MVRYIAVRLLSLIPSLFGLILLTFIMLHAVPADPVTSLAGENASPEQVAELRARFGLDKPLVEQFGIYVWQILQGDLGNSIFSNRPVLEEILARLPATLELITFALVLAAFVGITLGTIAAVRHNGPIDNIVRAVTISGLAIATFWVAIILQMVFSMELNWLPLRGRFDVAYPAPPLITGFLLIDSLLALDLTAFGIAAQHLAMPMITLAIPAIATIARFTRSGVLETMQKEFVDYASAVGYRRNRLIWIYVLKNSLSVVIMQLGLLFGALIGGAVAIEAIFDWPGIGSYAVNAILNFDYKAVLGVTIIIGIIYGIVNIIVDIIHAFVDPRLREGI
ncbi:MAG: ABC transporter permease [Hyphomicrobiaceae bacterium]|nr:ABC transporter permease [Hyphomicrobiaceae bacterium]